MRVKHPLSAETKLNISIWCSWCWCIPGWILPQTKAGVSDMTAWYDAGESCARWTVSCPSSPALYILAGAADHRRMWRIYPAGDNLWCDVMATYQIKLLPHYTHILQIYGGRDIYLSLDITAPFIYIHYFYYFVVWRYFPGWKRSVHPDNYACSSLIRIISPPSQLDNATSIHLSIMETSTQISTSTKLIIYILCVALPIWWGTPEVGTFLTTLRSHWGI